MASIIFGVILLIVTATGLAMGMFIAPDFIFDNNLMVFIVCSILFIFAIILFITGIIKVSNKKKQRDQTLSNAGITIDETRGVQYSRELDEADGIVDMPNMRDSATNVDSATNTNSTGTDSTGSTKANTNE